MGEESVEKGLGGKLWNAAAYALVALLAAAAANACSPDPEKKTLGDPTGSVCPPESTLTWATFGQLFIQENCARCHDEEKPRIVTQADVQANLGLIDRAAAAGPETVNTYMPEDEGVPESQRRALGEWLACGAP